MKKMIMLALVTLIGVVNYTQGAAAHEYQRMTVKEQIASREESVRDWTEVMNAIERGKRVSMDSPAYQRAQRALKHAQRMPGEGKAVAEWTAILSALERGKKIDTASPEFTRVHAARAKSETRLQHLKERPAAKTGGFLDRLGFGGAKKTETAPRGEKRSEKKPEVTKKAHVPAKKSAAKAKRGAVATTDVKKAKAAGHATAKPVAAKKGTLKKAEAKPASKKKPVKKKSVTVKKARAKRTTGMMHL